MLEYVIISITGDHLWEQATNAKSTTSCVALGVCNFTIYLLEVSKNKPLSGCHRTGFLFGEDILLKNHPYDPTSKTYHLNFGKK